MKKNIVPLVVLILAVSTVFADVSVYTDIETTGDVLLGTNVNTTGDVEVWIDGTSINQEIAQTKGAIESVASGLLTIGDLTLLFNDAAHWLNGGVIGSTFSKEIAYALDTYFASDYDISVLVNKINELDLRVGVLEKTMEEVAPIEFCEQKKIVLKDYNLTYVKCGKNTTVYANANGDFEGIDIISYTPGSCEEEWSCTQWSECTDGLQTRECVDKNFCESKKNKPEETRECVEVQQLVTQTVEAQQKEEVGPTGAFFGVHDRDYVIVGSYVILIISIILTFFNMRAYGEMKKTRKRTTRRKLKVKVAGRKSSRRSK